MKLILRLIKPKRGAWFNMDVNKWLKEYPAYNKLITAINKETIAIKSGQLITIRRSEEAAGIPLVPEGIFQQISVEKHAIIMEKNTGWYIKDVGSKLGTWVWRNKEFLDAKKEIKLENLDIIYLGKASDNDRYLNAIIEVRLV